MPKAEPKKRASFLDAMREREAAMAAEPEIAEEETQQDVPALSLVDAPAEGAPVAAEPPAAKTEATPAPAPKTTTESPAAQKAEVRAEPVVQVASSQAGAAAAREGATEVVRHVHIQQVMDGGRDARPYLQGLTDKGDATTFRLPKHVKAALVAYCDKRDAPMDALVGAVLDAYFRDLGLLPPKGEGNRPNTEFLSKMWDYDFS